MIRVITKHTLRLILLCLISGLVLLWWCLYTASGMRTVIRLAEPILATQHIHIATKNLSGNFSNIHAKQLTIKLTNGTVTLQNVHLDWHPWHLLTNTLSINILSADNISTTLYDSTTPKPAHHAHSTTSPFYIPNLPNFDIGTVNIKHYSITRNGHIIAGALRYQTNQWHISAIGSISDDIGIKINSDSNGHTQTTLATITSPQYSLSARNDGTYKKNSQWQASLNTLDIDTPLGRWHLVSPTNWKYSSDSLNLPQLCLDHQKSQLCLSITKAGNNWAINLNSNVMPLSQWQSQSTQFTTLNGFAQLSLHIENDNGHFRGKTHWSVKQFAIKPIQADALIQPKSYFQLQEFTAHATWKNQQIIGAINVAVNPTNTLNYDFTIDHFPTDTLPSTIQGSIALDLQDLGALGNIIPGVTNLAGSAKGSVKLSGNAWSPKASSNLTISNGAASLPLLGIHLNHTNVSVSSPKQGKIAFKLTTQSGNGHLNASGMLQNLLNQPYFNININGHNFTVLNIPAVNIIASPKLTIKRVSGQGILSGNILVSQATINADLFKNSAQSNPDIVYVNAQGQPAPSTPTLPFNTRVTVKLGKKIHISGYGINTNLSGQVHITSTANQATIGNGLLTLHNGSYHFYGKSFIINDGHITFANSLINDPSLNITGQFEMPPTGYSGLTQKLSIGVRIQGNAQHPKITLFSAPTLSQEDILSYIVLGRPIANADQGGQAALAQAALLLADQGGDKGLIASLQSKLGIDSIAFGTLAPHQPGEQNTYTDTNPSQNSETDNTAVFVGKSITPRLHLGVGVGLFNNTQEVTSSYQLTNYLKLNASTGNDQSGADLIFTINQ